MQTNRLEKIRSFSPLAFLFLFWTFAFVSSILFVFVNLHTIFQIEEVKALRYFILLAVPLGFTSFGGLFIFSYFDNFTPTIRRFNLIASCIQFSIGIIQLLVAFFSVLNNNIEISYLSGLNALFTFNWGANCFVFSKNLLEDSETSSTAQMLKKSKFLSIFIWVLIILTTIIEFFILIQYLLSRIVNIGLFYPLLIVNLMVEYVSSGSLISKSVSIKATDISFNRFLTGEIVIGIIIVICQMIKVPIVGMVYYLGSKSRNSHEETEIYYLIFTIVFLFHKIVTFGIISVSNILTIVASKTEEDVE
jgi:hypothetical protein